MYNWAGKKLLVLGATKIITEIVKEAQKYGAYVLVADYNESAPAKEIADKAVLLNVMDVDAVVEFVKNNPVDGILTGFTDSLMMPYFEVCNRLNLPCYLTKEQILQTTDKKIFKDLCKQFDIPVIEDYSVDNKKLDFPLIIKPVDNSGARGIYVCDSIDEYDECLKKSLRFSKSGKVLIEKYLSLPEATAFYVICNGKAILSAVADRHVTTVRKGDLRLPTGYTFPSVCMNNFSKNTDAKFQKLFEYMGMKNGVIFIQGFVDDSNEFIPYECGYRLTGSLEYKIFDKLLGYNPLAMMINFAFTGNMLGGAETISTMSNNQSAFNISCLVRPGKISKIEGIEELFALKEVVGCFLSYQEGDELPDEIWGRLAQIALRVLIVGSKSDYENVIKVIKDNVKFLDDSGENMLLTQEIIK